MTKYYEIEFSITGWGTALVEAENEDEAREKAREFDVLPHSDECMEWEFDRLTAVKFSHEDEDY